MNVVGERRAAERRWSTSVFGIAIAAAALVACSESTEPRLGSGAEALTSSVTIRRGTYGTVADATIAAAQPAKNLGAQKQLQVSAKNEALLRFDLSTIPANAVIQRADLTLTINGGDEEADDDGDDGDHEGHAIAPIQLHRATAAWTEGTVTYRSFAQAFAPAIDGTIILANRTSSKTVDVRALVQGWVAGSYPNFGVVLTTAGKQHTLVVASEHPTLARRPALVIRYATPDDHCTPNPCVHGACTNAYVGFTCECDPGYDGDTCDHEIDECAAGPCLNGGTCTDGLAGYTCGCPAGYTGANCETDVDECAPNPCQHGGTCTDGVNSHTCTCPAGTDGANCEIVVACSATTNPCQNGGTCTLLPGNTYSCACEPGFTGANCEQNPNDCPALNACNGHGTCADGLGTYTCACDPGYTGADCETHVITCADAPCLNGGQCSGDATSYACACAPGYTGTNCETDLNDCAAVTCENGGHCVDLVDAFACVCVGGYTGELCDVPPAVIATRLIVDAAFGTAGADVPIRARLVDADGAPLAGQSVHLEVSDLFLNTDVVTDPDGFATASVNMPALTHSIFITASFAGSALYAPSTGQNQVFIALASSAFGPLSVTGDFVGDVLLSSTTLTRVSAPAGPLAGESIQFTVTAPNLAASTTTVVTGVDGRASAITAATTRGSYAVQASYGGSDFYQGQQTGVVVHPVYQRTQLGAYAPIGDAGAPVDVSASLVALPGFAPIANQWVTFDFHGAASPAMVQTAGLGAVHTTVSFPNAGFYPFDVSFANVADYFVDQNGAQSPTTASGTILISACPDGTQPGPGGCSPCDPGTYSTGGAVCTACPAGTAQPVFGAGSALACQACADNTYSVAGSATCQACAVGFVASADHSSCVLASCAVGQAPVGGVCAPCDPGRYSADGAACLACPAGTYQDVAGASSCSTCPAGTVSEAGSASCNACPYPTIPSADHSTCVNGIATGINIDLPNLAVANQQLVIGAFLSTTNGPVSGATIAFHLAGPITVDETSVTDGGGAAAIAVVLPAGTYTVGATFFGSGTYLPAQPPPVQLVVAPAP